MSDEKKKPKEKPLSLLDRLKGEEKEEGKTAEAGASSPAPRRLPPAAAHVPQEVKDAVSLCMKAMLTNDLSYVATEDAKRVLERAVDYWAGVRVAAAGPWMPEVALGCAAVGAATVSVRRKRAIQEGRMKDDTPPPPPKPQESASASGAPDRGEKVAS